MKVLYNNKEIINGQFISPQNSQSKPIVNYLACSNTLYTLIMHDPDAPSGNHLHWIVINIPGNNINDGNTLLQYIGPSPPNGSGTHKYIFLLVEQREKKYLQPIQRAMSMDNLFAKLNLKDSTVISRVYFTSSNQTAGKKRNRTRAKSVSKKQKSINLKKRTKKEHRSKLS